MRDWNSIVVDRYFDDIKMDVRIGVGILDISRDIPSHLVRKRSFDMTFWMINQSLKLSICGYRNFHVKVSEILEESIAAGDELCVVMCQGMMALRLAEMIRRFSEYYKSNPNFFVLGHIMAHKGRYPGLHRQMLVINLKKWVELGKPEFNEIGIFWDRPETYSNFIVSEETISAEYTPAWIAGAEGTQEAYDVQDGSNWIDIACKNNIRIDNFDLEMRECKAFLYPYSDTDILEKIWYKLLDEVSIDDAETKPSDKLSNYTQRAWIRKLAYQEFIEKDRVYAFNTERLSSEGVRAPGPIDSLFSAAAGFKPIALLRNNGFHEGTVVNYFDWCTASINFKKHLLETWDGADFDKWLLEHDLEYNFSSTYRGNYSEFWKKEIEMEFGSAEEFQTLWNRYRKLKHNFYVIDIVNEPEKLFAEINNQLGIKVLWTTNIWASLALHWNVEPELLEEKWLKFESMIPEDLVLYGQDYLARDISNRIKNKLNYTHPRYVERWTV
jgi:hypothetical protein